VRGVYVKAGQFALPVLGIRVQSNTRHGILIDLEKIVVADLFLDVLFEARLDRIVESDVRTRSAHAPGASASRLRRTFSARAGIDVAFDARDGRIGDLATAARARVKGFAATQFMQCAVIRLDARALIDDRAVPLHPACFERAQDIVASAAHHTRPVQILHANEPCAVAAARVEIARDRGDEGTKVQRTARRRREAAAVGTCRQVKK